MEETTMSNKSLEEQEVPPPIPPRSLKKKTQLLNYGTDAGRREGRKFVHTTHHMQSLACDELHSQSTSVQQTSDKKEYYQVKTSNNYSLDVRLKSKDTFRAENHQSPHIARSDEKPSREREPSLRKTKASSTSSSTRRLGCSTIDDLMPWGSHSYHSIREVSRSEMFFPCYLNKLPETASKELKIDKQGNRECDTCTDILNKESGNWSENYLTRRHAKRRNAICFELQKEVRGDKAQNRLQEIYRDTLEKS